MNRFAVSLYFSSLLILSPLSRADDAPKGREAAESDAVSTESWTPLEDKWVSSQFGGDGPIEVNGNDVSVRVGDPLTGVRWEGDAPKENFEIELEAKRTDGFDFFCGLTFPVAKSHVTFVLGGWGGGVVGISNIDGLDASENEQTFYRTFDKDRWYKIRARVDPYQIKCFIDDKAVIEQPRANHTFDLRFEMDLCKPIGIAAYQCDAKYRNIRIRKLTAQELTVAKKEEDVRLAQDE